jgi:hypothetical protein
VAEERLNQAPDDGDNEHSPYVHCFREYFISEKQPPGKKACIGRNRLSQKHYRIPMLKMIERKMVQHFSFIMELACLGISVEDLQER